MEEDRNKTNIADVGKGCGCALVLTILIGSCIGTCTSDPETGRPADAHDKTEETLPLIRNFDGGALERICTGEHSPQEGTLYRSSHDMLKVGQVFPSKGVVCGLIYEWRKNYDSPRDIFIKTTRPYADGDMLKNACYLCAGRVSGKTVLGAPSVLYAFEEIDEAIVEKLRNEHEQWEKENASLHEKLEKWHTTGFGGTNDGKRIEEVCGFKMGQAAIPDVPVDSDRHGIRSQKVSIPKEKRIPPFTQATLTYSKKGRLHYLVLTSPAQPKRAEATDANRKMSAAKFQLEKALAVRFQETVSSVTGVTNCLGTCSRGGKVTSRFGMRWIDNKDMQIEFELVDHDISRSDNFVE